MFCSSGDSLDCISKYKIIVFVCLVVFPGCIKGALQCTSNNTVLEIIPKIYPDEEDFSPPKITPIHPIPNTSCTWNITAPIGNVVFIELKIYHLTYNKTVCQQSESLHVFDGPTASSNLIYSSCSNLQASNSNYRRFFTTGRYALVKYQAPNTNVSYGFVFFSITVSSFKKTTCSRGLDTNLTAFANATNNITSPYYKYGYPKDARCAWRISAPAGYIIKLEPQGLLACDGDRLEFYDSDQNDPQKHMRTICRTPIYDKKIISTGNTMYIMFFGNSSEIQSNIDRYFIVYYTAFLPGNSCSKSNTDDQNQNIIIRPTNNGTIQSPNFPNKFPAYLDCKWKLIAPSGYAIKLFMDTVNINVKSCNYILYDYLRIFDGLKDEVSPYLGYATCQTSSFLTAKPSFYALSSRNEMRVEFKTGGSEPTGYGFQGIYSLERLDVSGTCGEMRNGTIHLRGQGATFFSPGFQFMNKPQHPKDMTCIWSITVNPGYTILLRSKENNLQIGCSVEYTKVYDGTSLSSPLLGTMCKEKRFDVLYSSGNNMIVEMKTSSSSQRGKGILMTYRAVKYKKPNYLCSASSPVINIENKKTATVISPWYPVEYPNNIRCLYRFKVPFASIANVKITNLHMQESGNCTADRLRVTGGTYWNSPIRGEFCGKKLSPINISSSGRNLMIDFKTDWRYQFPGFEAVFYSTEDESYGDCKVEGKDNLIYMNASSGVLYSPRYPKDIPPNMMCTWVITVPEGGHVRLDFHHFDLDYSCTGKSQLEVRDGESVAASEKVGTYCKTDVPKSIFSSGRHLWVRFSSSDKKSYVDKGFNASYSTVTAIPSKISMSCSNGNLNKIKSSSGEIASHSYPLNYANDVECGWQITVPDGKRVKLTFESFNLQETPGCSGDFVQVFDGMSKFGDSLGKFCGSSKPEPIQSDGTWMYIQFKTDKSGQYPGFKASFEAVLSVKSIIMIVMFTLVGVGALCSIIGWCLKGKVYRHNPDPSPPDGAAFTAGSNIELTSKM